MCLCRDEMAADVHNPTMVMGDFNARPNSLGPVVSGMSSEPISDIVLTGGEVSLIVGLVTAKRTRNHHGSMVWSSTLKP